MPDKDYKITDLSPHLFWDVDAQKLDWERNKPWIILRVLEYGLLQDWIIIKNKYGMQTIGEVSTTFRSMDPVTLSFVSFMANIPKNKFRCYSTIQSNPPHWNF